VNERQDDWYDLLPLAEFQHNNHIHSATQHPPFLLDTGRLPCMGFEPQQNPSGLETVNEFTERMRTAIKEAKLSQKVTYLFCDELDIVSKELRSRVRQATKDVVKSEV